MLGKSSQPLIVFSIYSNGKKLFACGNSGQSSDTIQCIDGIRAISTLWVVYIHGCRIFTFMPLRESVAYDEVIDSILNQLKNYNRMEF